MPAKEEKKQKRQRKILKNNPILQYVIRHKLRIRSIRMKLMVSFSIVIALIILLGIITYNKASDIIIKNYKTSAFQTISANGNYIKLICDSVEAKSTQIVSNANITKYYAGGFTKNSNEEYNTYNAAYQDLLATVGSDKFIYSINIISTKYNPISTFANFSSDEYKEFPNSEEAVLFDQSGQKMMWTGYHNFLDQVLRISTDKYAISLTRYLYNKSLKPIGYVIIDIKTDSIQQVIDGIDFGGKSNIAFVSGDGRILTKGNVTAEDENQVLNEKFYLESLQDTEGRGSKDVNYLNEKYLYLYNRIGDTGAILYSLIPESVILKQVNEIKKITLGIVAIAIVIAILISTAISIGFSSTIKKIVAGVKKAALGDLTVHINSKRKDELGILEESISDMIFGMKQLIEKTVLVSDTVKNSALFVGSTAGSFIDLSKDIAVSLDNLEQGTYQQASDAQNCLLMMDHLSERIGEVYENTGGIEDIASNTKEIVNNGKETISDLEERVADTSNMAKIIIDEIAYLKKEAEAIRDIISTMKYIADQTNLLSLNASIEAARAGHAGMGFAVVAEEIRKLSGQSMEASNKVKDNIERIASRTIHMVEIANKTSVVVQSQEKALTDTVSIFNRIDQHVDNLVGFLSKISDGVKTVEEVKSNTLGSIESISSIIEEAAAVTGDVNGTAQNQLTLAEKLNEATTQLEKNSTILEEAVKMFTI
jgi:methyl-accepting chemotaxis protein